RPTSARTPLSLHAALPISERDARGRGAERENRQRGEGGGCDELAHAHTVAERAARATAFAARASPKATRHANVSQRPHPAALGQDRKSTRLNSSHVKISYA